MANLNSVTLTGNTTKDVDHRTTQSGTEVANVTIAVNGFKEGDTSFVDLEIQPESCSWAGPPHYIFALGALTSSA